MKIKVKTNILIPEKIPAEGELELEPGETLGAVLLELSKGSCLETLIAKNESDKGFIIDDMWEVGLNGRACYDSPQDFKKPLQEGDVVTVWLTPLGGG